jgi:uncharacterized protein YrrD
MRKASEITELPVLSIQEGVNTEKVSRFAVNPATKKVEYVSFVGTPWFEVPNMMPWSKIKAIGRDLITIKTKKDITPVNDELHRQLSRTVEIIGTEVIDSSGRMSGKVTDFAVDEATGDLRKIMLTDGGLLDISAVVTISATTIVTEGGAEDKGEAPFSESEFLLGKTVAANISDDNGAVIIPAGTVITAREIEAAKAGNALYDLVTGVK